MRLAGKAELAPKAHVQVTEHSEELAQVSMLEWTAVSSRLERSRKGKEREEENPSGGRRSGRRRLPNRAVTRPEFGECESTEDSTLSIMRHPALCP